MLISFDAPVRAPANERSERHQELQQDPRWVSFGIRLDHSDELARDAVEGCFI
jgi:hypothetical protein